MRVICEGAKQSVSRHSLVALAACLLHSHHWWWEFCHVLLL